MAVDPRGDSYGNIVGIQYDGVPQRGRARSEYDPCTLAVMKWAAEKLVPIVGLASGGRLGVLRAASPVHHSTRF